VGNLVSLEGSGCFLAWTIYPRGLCKNFAKDVQNRRIREGLFWQRARLARHGRPHQITGIKTISGFRGAPAAANISGPLPLHSSVGGAPGRSVRQQPIWVKI